MLKNPIFRDNVATDKMVAMKGAERPFYASSTQNKLNRSIAKGFKKEGAVSAKWNKKLGKYEIFKGTHRLKGSKEHGWKTTPLWDYTKVEGYDRKRCIAEGYKDNDLHAALNPMARCYAYIEYSKIVMKEKGMKKSTGRNPTHAVALVAQGMGDSIATVANHMKFDEFPKVVKNLIGEGKFRIKQAVIASRMIGKVSEEVIVELCTAASKQWWKPSRVAYEVNQILEKKNVTHRVCYACKQRKAVDEFTRMTWNGEALDMCRECYSALNKTIAFFFHKVQTRAERLSELRSRFQLERSV